MKEEAREYFLQLEAYYQKRIGRPLILSPKDVEAVTSWWDQGVPLEAAMRGLDDYLKRLEKDPRNRRRRLAVRYAANEVMDAAEDLRTARIGDRRGEGVEDRERVGRLLEDLAGRLEEAAAGVEDVTKEVMLGTLLRERAVAVRAIAEPYRAGDWKAEDLEDRLVLWDEEILAAVREGAGDQARREIRLQAEAGLSDMRSRMEEKAWEKTVALLEEKLLRERYGLPRLSLYGY